jgi:hypothetical protein
MKPSWFVVYRAGIVAFAAFVSALVGFSLQFLLPAAYLADSKGMIGSVVGLIAALVSIVLGLLIWTSHGQFREQQSHLQTVAGTIVRFDFALKAYGVEAAAGRALLRKQAKRTADRFWNHAGDRGISYSDLDEELDAMRRFFAILHPANDEQKHHFAIATELFGKIIETQILMVRSLGSQLPALLLDVVTGWACLLFFGYGLEWNVNALTVLIAAAGAGSVASAVFLIVEMSNPYTGLLRAPRADFDWLLQILAAESENGLSDSLSSAVGVIAQLKSKRVSTTLP